MEIGDTDPVRLYNLVSYYKEIGYENYFFKMYEGYAHDRPLVINDIMEDIRLYREDVDLSKYISSDGEVASLIIEEWQSQMVYHPDDIRNN